VTAPAPGRAYWICQAAGWGGFLTYVLGAYLLTTPPEAVDIASIVFFNAVVCPAASHALRHWMYVHGWHQLSAWRLFPRLVGVVAGFAGGITVAVVLSLVLAGQPAMPFISAFSIAAGFAMAFTGWLTIYFAVQARRKRDALQLELAVVARDAQLQSLRAQINPHFLFNCLNSLRHLIVTEPRRAEVMVTGLAELLRYSLAADRTASVALSEELRIVDEYLALERVRLDDRLTVERAVAPDALHARIPPMLIQTLADNAIKHGIAELPGGGIVRIEARAANGRVDILVANTGHLKPVSDDGRGLENTRKRLRLIYGEAATFSLQEIRGTVEARVALPMAPS
jgi:sensor histidine kinase YesM